MKCFPLLPDTNGNDSFSCRRRTSEKRLDKRLILNGTLHRHLADTNERAINMLERLIDQMAAQEGITESLKAEKPLEWVGRMNSIRSRAEENIMHDVILTL